MNLRTKKFKVQKLEELLIANLREEDVILFHIHQTEPRKCEEKH